MSKFQDFEGRKPRRGDLACFNSFEAVNSTWNIATVDSSGRNVYFSPMDYWILLDMPWHGRVDILHPTHGVLNVPITPRAIRLVTTASKENNNE